MCHLYVNADKNLYASRTRTFRIHGLLTSIRLENLMWDILDRMAAEENRSTNNLVTTLYDELMEKENEVHNFSSFLRVTCLIYLQHRDAPGTGLQPVGECNRVRRAS